MRDVKELHQDKKIETKSMDGATSFGFNDFLQRDDGNIYSNRRKFKLLKSLFPYLSKDRWSLKWAVYD